MVNFRRISLLGILKHFIKNETIGLDELNNLTVDVSILQKQKKNIITETIDFIYIIME